VSVTRKIFDSFATYQLSSKINDEKPTEMAGNCSTNLSNTERTLLFYLLKQIESKYASWYCISLLQYPCAKADYNP